MQQKRTAIYVRYDKGFIDKDIVAKLQNFIDSRKDWILGDTFVDDGFSGLDEKRPEYLKMVKKCMAGELDVICIDGIHHLSRDTAPFIELLYQLRKLGVVIFNKETNSFIENDADSKSISSFLSLMRKEYYSLRRKVRGR